MARGKVDSKVVRVGRASRSLSVFSQMRTETRVRRARPSATHPLVMYLYYLPSAGEVSGEDTDRKANN